MLTIRNAKGKNIKRGYIIRDDNGKIVPFQFNPSTWTEEHGAVYNYVDSPGSYYPEINYSGQATRKLPLNIILDGIGHNIDIEKRIQEFIDLTKPSNQNVKLYGGKTFAEPPRCRFVWGNSVKKVVVTIAKVERQFFDEELKTMVAELTIEMLEYV